MSAFYQLREQGPILREDEQKPIGESPADVQRFDSEEFAQRYLRPVSGGLSCHWSVEGLHCAACVWLLERLPQLHPGVQQARVNFADASLETVFDPAQLTPSQVLDLVAKLGYRLHPFGDPEAERAARVERRRWLLRLAVAIACTMASMHLSWSVLAGHATQSMDVAARQFFGLLALVVALPALTWSAVPFYRGAVIGLQNGRFVLDASIAAVLVFGTVMTAVQVYQGSPNLYIDALAMFVAFLLVGRVVLFWTQDMVRRRCRPAQDIVPPLAQRLVNGSVQQLASTDLQIDDCVLVQRDHVLPCDGVLQQDSAVYCETAALTGESRPMRFEAGAMLLAGYKLLSEDCQIQVTAVGEDTRLGHLVSEVRRGGWKPTPLTQLLDKVQAWFSLAVAVLAAGTWGLWMYLDPNLAWQQCIAVVLVACPCALGLAAPLAYGLAVSGAARAGILLRDGGVIEALATARTIVWDKTGTLTHGQPAVVNWHWHTDVDEAEKKRLLAAVLDMEEQSGHPIAHSLCAYITDLDIEKQAVQDLEHVIGGGMQAVMADGRRLQIGSAGYLGVELEGEPTATCIGLCLDDELLAVVSLRDRIRDDMAELIASLHQCQHVLLSGDGVEVTQEVAAQLGIAQARGGCRPEDKAEFVRQCAQRPIVMIGDGLNDAPALQAADVGIGMRGGLEAALASADVYLPQADAPSMATLFSGATRATRRLRWTLMWAVIYNLIAVALVVAGFWGPYVCAVAMPASSLAVVLMLVVGPSPWKRSNGFNPPWE